MDCLGLLFVEADFLAPSFAISFVGLYKKCELNGMFLMWNFQQEGRRGERVRAPSCPLRAKCDKNTFYATRI